VTIRGYISLLGGEKQTMSLGISRLEVFSCKFLNKLFIVKEIGHKPICHI
jgi:hypothetical protein